MGGCRQALGWLLLFSLAINLLVLASPIYMMQVFDRVLSSGRTETLLFLTLIAGVAVLILGLLEATRSRLSHRVGGWLEGTLAAEVIAASMRASLADRSATAEPLRDLSLVRATLSSPALNAFLDMPWVPVFILVIWLLHPWLGLIALAAAAFLFTVALLNEFVSRRPLREAGRRTILATHAVDAGLRNAEAIQAMGMLPALLSRYAAVHDGALALQRRAGDRSAALIGLSKFLRLFVQIVILGAGALLVLRGALTAGGMIAASILLGRALAPVEQSIGAWKQLVAGRESWRRLRRLLESAPVPARGMSLPPPKGDFSCEAVSYAATGRPEPILNGISFTLRAGEALGVIGPSAAGKSTLCRILVGVLKPTRGHARLDGADVYAWRADDLGPHIGYLPQDVELFSGTVRENVARLGLQPDRDLVVEAARVAGVHEMILRLPQGYETQIGEGGVLLSGGQRQRLGLARALYNRPRLIVLDEPNASLDAHGEKALVKAIATARRWGATIVLVAQQPSVLRPVDKVMVLRSGGVEAFGRRDDLLGRPRVARDPARQHAGAAAQRLPEAQEDTG